MISAQVRYRPVFIIHSRSDITVYLINLGSCRGGSASDIFAYKGATLPGTDKQTTRSTVFADTKYKLTLNTHLQRTRTPLCWNYVTIARNDSHFQRRY